MNGFERFVYRVFPVDPKFRMKNIWTHIGVNLLCCVVIVIAAVVRCFTPKGRAFLRREYSRK